MKIIEIARQYKDEYNEGIAWIAVWQEATKNGKRSWHTECFFPDDMDKETPKFDEEKTAQLAEISGLDSNAVLLNGYYHSWIGSADEPLNAMSISKGIENHYLMHNALIKSYLAGETDEDETETPAFEDLQLTEREELGLGRERREDSQGENGMSASDVPDTITIEFPAENVNEEILHSLIDSKATLIKAALGEDGTGELPIEFADGKVKFEWLWFGNADAVTAWSAFLAAAVKFSKTAKRITAKDGAVENQKFSFRVFLIKLKMDGPSLKWHRRYLLRNLPGDSAFATPESKERWVEKQRNKAAHTANEEGGDEVSE